MSRTTIDFGIDLGTTNSAIAVLKGVTPEIVKNNAADADITPSVVSIDKRGIIQVGQRAKNRLIDTPNDAYGEFKRRMGTDFIYTFAACGQHRKPEELSAEVLKSLRADVQQRLGEVVDAAVITVPAAFELHQCDATRKAAQLAGFHESPLLQEPVAAALAYGFQKDDDKAYWLVYDFGGGTFDAALIKSEEGTIHVVNHGGDNFLGGSDIDWAIVDQCLIPKFIEQFHPEDFTRANKRWAQAFAKLKRSAEIAKIDLSRGERAMLETCRIQDGQGEEYEFDCELTRNDIIQVARPIILKSVEICKKVLEEKNLNKEAIAKVILVGGPTLAPYFRDILTENLGIPLDFAVDPLTVVAKGAAIFAGTQKAAANTPQTIVPGGFTADLKYKPVGADANPVIGGRITSETTPDLSGYTIELAHTKTQWRSGRIALKPDGVFMTELLAEKGERNLFVIELFDAKGVRQSVAPSEITYTIGSVVEEQPLINSMGISLLTNAYEKLFEKGRGLPLKTTRDFRTVDPLRRGNATDKIRIPVVEGEHESADRNRLVGCLEICGADIKRDLPAGTEVQVTLRMDSSRILTVQAYVPALDEEFETRLDLRHHTPIPQELQKDFDAEMDRFEKLKAKTTAAKAVESQTLIRNITESPVLKEVRDTLATAQSDPDAASKCEKRLLEFKLLLDQVSGTLEWPTLVAEIRDWLDHLSKVADPKGADAEKVADFAFEVEPLIEEKQPQSLRKKIEQASRLYFEIVTAQPGWWTYQLEQMQLQKDKMKDQARASCLLEQGKEYQKNRNTQALQGIVQQLWELLPNDILQGARRGYQSGLVR
jgi:molecular chaperone DnaK